MIEEANAPTGSLTSATPDNQSGRDTLARYHAQFRAAAFHALAILDGTSIDFVYCDYHDDFVTQETKDGKPRYSFYQVKTVRKKNQQWSVREVFGVPQKGKTDASKVGSSFAGKLLIHTVRFGDSCTKVVFLTNIQLDAALEATASCISNGDDANRCVKILRQVFNEAIPDASELPSEQVVNCLKKLHLEPGREYLHPDDATFTAIARDAIYKYSEVDLAHVEADEIIANLLRLIETRSSTTVLANVTEAELNLLVGVGIRDLLSILSISAGAYQELLAGKDPSAVRTASLIQRKFAKAGASEELIAYLSKCKVHWDTWLRDKRHTVPELELNVLQNTLTELKNEWCIGVMKLEALQAAIEVIFAQCAGKPYGPTITREILLGGVLSAFVRGEAR